VAAVTEARPAAGALDGETALGLLRTMWRIRAFEARAGVPRCVGREGVAVAVCAQLGPHDVVYGSRRAHAYAIARGVTLDRVVARSLDATGVVGGDVPAALGGAMAELLGDGDQVAVAVFGEGGPEAGRFGRSAGLATVWELPVIFVRELRRPAAFAPSALRRESVDGDDVVAVWDACGRLLEATRRGDGPMLLECLEREGEGDPIARLRGHGVAAGWFGEEAAARAERDAHQAVDEAVRLGRDHVGSAA
jgi:TPP-dependent pyruvate/acetoin dehydrogenase alpha subunit